MKVRWSFGQGAWARIPWLALLDDRVAKATSDGIYVIYLFREDMSGVYATLNHGITRAKERLGADAGRAAIRQRSEELRRFATDLDEAGFMLTNEIDLHTEHALGKDYQHGTVAHRLYKTGSVPPTNALVGDLRLLLEAYDRAVKAQLARRV
jgi:5-methylcytosine-specific restriction protein B